MTASIGTPRLAAVAALLSALSWSATASAAEFASQWRHAHDRVWAGPEYWANPMEDWRVHNGRLECLIGMPNRNVHLLTHQLSDSAAGFECSVRLGLLSKGRRAGSAGFAIGVYDADTQGDWRSNLLFGEGLAAGITSDGKLFIGDEQAAIEQAAPTDDLVLRLIATHEGEQTTLVLSAHHAESDEKLAETSRQAPSARLRGNIALVNNFAGNQRPGGKRPGNLPTFWFSDWKVSGERITADEAHRFGPILYAMHTLSRDVLKMTAQMPPIGAEESQSVRLQVKNEAGQWQTVAEQPIDPLSRTATFRVEDWDDGRDVPYRLAYTLVQRDGAKQESTLEGTVKADPVDKPEISVAGFTGNTDSGFPNTLIVRNVGIMNPDVLFFSGDQIYENVGGYGIHREPVKLATLNYLRKIYLWGWAFRDLMRDRPTLVMPDDHDVYQPNIWGENGRDCGGIDGHDQGGFAMPADWVNAVQRTQSAHHPDAYDPTPIERGITVYYGDMLYGRISFAIIEDRKFKSGPAGKVNTWEGRADHVKDPNFDPATIDKPGLVLLGQRQLDFLNAWTADWRGADQKVVVSQTIFCNLANYHGAAQEYLVADLDSNGWPQTPRNKAVEAIRRGFALHYAGDQHLASIVHQGVDTWRDSMFSFCVPSIAAGYPRSWRPDDEGLPVRNRPAPALANTGDYKEGLGNHVTVYAVGNPEPMNRPGRINTLHDKASGFGLVRFNKAEGTITMECYRLQIDTSALEPDDQFPGWPKTIALTDNYGRAAAAWLPELRTQGLENPVVQVIDEQGEVVYTLRVRGTSFQPKVFTTDGSYRVRIGEPDTDTWQTLEDLKPSSKEAAGVREVQF